LENAQWQWENSTRHMKLQQQQQQLKQKLVTPGKRHAACWPCANPHFRIPAVVTAAENSATTLGPKLE